MKTIGTIARELNISTETVIDTAHKLGLDYAVSKGSVTRGVEYC